MPPSIGFIDLDGRTRVAAYGGTGETIILVHGLGGYIENWNSIAGNLTEFGAVHALDLAGFGHSDPEGRSTTVQANAELLWSFVDQVAGPQPLTLVGNSMGGLVAMIAAASKPEAVHRLVLIDPAVPVLPSEYEPAVAATLALPTVPVAGPAYLARLWKSESVADVLRRSQELVYADPSRADPDRVTESMAYFEVRRTLAWAPQAFSAAARSIALINRSRKRFMAMIAPIMARTLVIHGDRDKLVPLSAARWLVETRPDWTLEVLQGVGHVPMLEAPKETLEVIAEWWEAGGG